MASQYDLYSPKSAPRQNFEDTLDSLQSVPDVGILDTIESGIDRAANTGWMMSTVNGAKSFAGPLLRVYSAIIFAPLSSSWVPSHGAVLH